jgi:ribonucleotide reductase beta subunit family protein with ferritin-like domain
MMMQFFWMNLSAYEKTRLTHNLGYLYQMDSFDKLIVYTYFAILAGMALPQAS